MAKAWPKWFSVSGFWPHLSHYRRSLVGPRISMMTRFAWSARTLVTPYIRQQWRSISPCQSCCWCTTRFSKLPRRVLPSTPLRDSRDPATCWWARQINEGINHAKAQMNAPTFPAFWKMSARTCQSSRGSRKLPPLWALWLEPSLCAGCRFSYFLQQDPLSVAPSAAVYPFGWKEQSCGLDMPIRCSILLSMRCSTGICGQPITTCWGAGTGPLTGSSPLQECTRLWSWQKGQNWYCRQSKPFETEYISGREEFSLSVNYCCCIRDFTQKMFYLSGIAHAPVIYRSWICSQYQIGKSGILTYRLIPIDISVCVCREVDHSPPQILNTSGKWSWRRLMIFSLVRGIAQPNLRCHRCLSGLTKYTVAAACSSGTLSLWRLHSPHTPPHNPSRPAQPYWSTDITCICKGATRFPILPWSTNSSNTKKIF